ncbi:hypothetical protein FIU97_12695 [Roseivivax sp. THAF40]|uniref:hypothetical protein n=1 Tax=unclassified Roseivivax TaxID=2639302 RepID=UPI0012688368|nr:MULTISPECIES: hypothetical protein [unclassified Roseivivax]QFS83624.1 hypothetical protein FIV09_12375 [Roseivivax sp. THAF197b]QFT47432.1 hypothetical protein FIU97_12695 [Roseivivax sp. THAF40]
MFKPGSPSSVTRDMQRAIAAQVPRKVARDLWNRVRYGTEAPQSDECIWVDPLAVKHSYIGTGDVPLRRSNSGQVLPGDWDLNVRPLVANTKEISCRLHFVEGLPWRETPIYQKLKGLIEAGKRPDALSSIEELDARYERLDRLWEYARREGLRPRRDTPDYYRREHGGILVHVGRDGRLIRSGGAMHRFAVARLLQLPRIPAQLGAVHPAALKAGYLDALRQPPSTART